MRKEWISEEEWIDETAEGYLLSEYFEKGETEYI